MQTFKDELINWAGSLPDDATLDDVEYFVMVRRRVEEGLRDADAGRAVAHETVRQQVQEWLKSPGPAAR